MSNNTTTPDQHRPGKAAMKAAQKKAYAAKASAYLQAAEDFLRKAELELEDASDYAPPYSLGKVRNLATELAFMSRIVDRYQRDGERGTQAPFCATQDTQDSEYYKTLYLITVKMSTDPIPWYAVAKYNEEERAYYRCDANGYIPSPTYALLPPGAVIKAKQLSDEELKTMKTPPAW